ncbi:head decoration protein [Pararhizobium mangrovi]|uniref:Head decoration protein n=1 Tax=Pararhizobium mangrovi TaxID=2590452 RepID=A0A506TXI8_9HYPH|nr:head decoration protein [Pararhizobium mangrovi]TPW26026.1 head decoration protein [Pararhizobium mangrovi]
MAEILKEAKHNADFIVSEANGYRSRETGSIAGGDDGVRPGTIVSVSSGTYSPVAVDGTAAGILYEGVPAGETVDRTFVVRDAEVSGADLVYPDGATDTQKATLKAGLNSLGIAVR